MFIAALEKESWEGIFNGTAPNPVSNKKMTKVLTEAASNFSDMMPVPAFALRLAMGEMADVVLHGTRVSAEKVTKHGFSFQFPELEPALMDLLVRKI